MIRRIGNFKSYLLIIGIFLVLGFLTKTANTQGAVHFYDDDPLWIDADTQDASGVQPWKIDLFYDSLENSFTRPGDKRKDLRAMNVNTVDEVPDSSWFTNRAGMKKLTVDEVTMGPNTTEGPAPGVWTIIASKSDGVTPGFTIKDTNGVVWFIKFDPPGYLGMATGTEVVITKLFWALGYNVAEDHISSLRVDNLQIAEGATIEPPGGRKRQMVESDIKDLLEDAEQESDGSYRVHASKGLPGKVLGGFRTYGTRPDDPNDVVPHEHRRELRGYGTFAAWFNHVDAKAIQSMDTLITENGKSFVRHYLLDFSSAMGAGSTHPREYWEGYEYIIEEPGTIAKGIPTFGFYILPWRKAPYYESTSVGNLATDENWDPDKWFPRYSNSAFLHARADDKFWAARKAMAISDDMIRAAVKTGEFNDPASEDVFATVLITRRNNIGRKYLTAINPVVDPSIDAMGKLTFRNAAVDAGFASAPAGGYQAVWYRFNNATGESTRIGGTVGSTSMQVPSGLPTEAGSIIKVEISAAKGADPSWELPVQSYFRFVDGSWKLVGFQRLPDVWMPPGQEKK